MKDNKTAIAMVLDMSGSMQHLATDTIGGFNTFIKEQQELPGEAQVTLALFNHKYMKAFTKDLKDVQPLDHATYRPGGNTALLDAIGRTIYDLGTELSAMPENERPSKVLVVIMTDGQENCSEEYTLDKIRDMIKLQQETYKWEFIFTGAGIDAVAAGAQMGFAQSQSASYAHNTIGTKSLYADVSRSARSFRSGGSGKINN